MLQDIVTPLIKESGVSIDMISQSIGHQNVDSYCLLKDFDNNIIDDANEKLLQEPSLIIMQKKCRFSA
jgi:hypothetical protein